MDSENMILEFKNGDQLQVMTIFGGPVTFDGITRDVLTIEIDNKTTTVDNLKHIFSNASNMTHLYTYEDTFDENGDSINIKIEIGEGYTILLGIEEITRKVDHIPGKMLPDEYETIYIVTIAQMTYDEWVEAGYNE